MCKQRRAQPRKQYGNPSETCFTLLEVVPNVIEGTNRTIGMMAVMRVPGAISVDSDSETVWMREHPPGYSYISFGFQQRAQQ
jgi:hypothetical protein